MFSTLLLKNLPAITHSVSDINIAHTYEQYII